jgi:hypothetical protein
MQKIVIPNTDISGDGSASRCLYNDTMFAARLYTRRAKTYPPQSTSGDGNSNNTTGGAQFQPWPYAVEIKQSIGGGERVPDCYRSVDGKLGARVDLPAAAGSGSANGECECRYLNFGT